METMKYKKLLEKELKLVEGEMQEIARKNPDKKGDWEAIENDFNVDQADEEEVAEDIENFNANESLLRSLEPKYNDIKLALEKIKKGTYGKCEVGGEDIPEKRLEANPAARSCIEHSKTK